MRKHFIYLLIATFVSITTNAAERLYTTLDVLRPAKVSFPADADKILIINNSSVQPFDYGHKTELLNDKARNVRENTDSLSIFCLSALAEELSDKYFFKSIVLHQNSVNKSNLFFTLQPLTADTIQKLCKKYDVNVVLSLDRIKENDRTAEYFLGNNINIDKPFVSNFEVKYETIWSVYYPPEDPHRNAFVLHDTLYWENEAAEKQFIQTGLPKRYDALVDGALYTGRNTVKKLVPWWDKVDRYFFSSSSAKMKEAIDSVYVKNWNAAIDIWKNILNTSKNSSLKAKAANNIAVCYEINNDIDKALEYAQESLTLSDNSIYSDYNFIKQILDYVQQLKTRQKEIQLIKEQLGE
jgi:hypothetical protein